MAQGKGAVRLHSHWGHLPIREALARARERNSLPSALLIHGPRGVGKQHLALWIGRLLLCSSPGPQGPCEGCRNCTLAMGLEHPDLHWYFPLPRPKNASTPEKLADALEEARWETLKEIRKNPLRPVASGEARALYLAAARTLRHQAQKRPFMGPRQIFVIADAESLAPQESSSEAANALLKLLEEPPEGTTLILTSGEPGRLLPTIRSRATQLHLPPLSPEEVAGFLEKVAGIRGEEARRLAALGQGSIGRALGFRKDGEEIPPLERTRREAFDLLAAALAPAPEAGFQASLNFKPVGARGLQELLDFVEEGLRDLAAAAAGATTSLWNPDQERLFGEALGRKSIPPTAAARAVERVQEARVLAAGNLNPQLLVFGLLREIRRELLGPAQGS